MVPVRSSGSQLATGLRLRLWRLDWDMVVRAVEETF
jgi:hypothetical protein